MFVSINAQEPVMSLRDNELARRQDGRLELRPRPLRVRWNLKDLTTADGHELNAAFTCSARGLPDVTERKMLEEVLLGSGYAVSDENLATHFEPKLHAAAAKAVQAYSAAQWLEDSMSSELTETLRNAAAKVAFDCGVEILPPFTLDLQSPTYQQQQLRARQQALMEKQTAEQVEHVQRAGEMLKQFRSIRDSAPELSPGRVLQQISVGDRGAMLQTLLLASAKETEASDLWAVAGPYLVRIDRSDSGIRPQLYPLPPELGPLRSVQPATVNGKSSLLIGARDGIMSVNSRNPTEPPQLFHDQPSTESALGFNRAVYRGDRYGYAASHGAAGIVCWRTDQNKPESSLRVEKLGLQSRPVTSGSTSESIAGPRNLEVLNDGAMIFSAGARLFTFDGTDATAIATPSNSEIIAILPEDKRLVVVHEDGTICTVDRASRDLACLQRRSNRLRSAGPLPWLGSVRLLLAEDAGTVECIGLDDPLVTQYQSQHRSLRAIAGSREMVAGISSDRQRLLLWNSWDGRQPVAEIYLTGLTRHRIADVDFG
jgi:hypothetical protein